MGIFIKNVGTVIGAPKIIKSMVINNGKIIIDGKATDIPTDYPNITINIQGDIERLEVEQCEKINISGNAKRVKTNCGSIDVQGDIQGDAHTNCGSISCKVVEGDAHTNMGSIYKGR